MTGFERLQSVLALAVIVQGGFFLMKESLYGAASGMLQL
jgi:hypothetical protein